MMASSRADLLVALGGFGVKADDEPVVGADVDLLTCRLPAPLQEPSALRGAAVGDRDGGARFQSRISVLTWRISAESAVLPGRQHTRTGMPVRVTAMPTTTWGRSSRK
jgi:hypothetical protein